MIIDFKEIPQANKGNGQQDRFELFACDLLETIGFKILRRPDRGADGKKDMIVSEIRKGIEGETIVKWLVSCKHNAYSGTSVKDTDEPDIIDRVTAHLCDGFMGIYSTLPASSLSNKLHSFGNKIQSTIFDSARIEKEIMNSNQRNRILISYFPSSHDKFQKSNSINDELHKKELPINNQLFTEEDVFRITKTAIIVLEIENIKEKYFETNDSNERIDLLRKIYKYSDHSNHKIAGSVFEFLDFVSHQTRAGICFDIAMSIYFLILSFYPTIHHQENTEKVANGKRCIFIGFNIVYGALKYLNNFSIAAQGLMILKFIYREGKRNNIQELVDEVLIQYNLLANSLDQFISEDHEKATELLSCFKIDLDSLDLSFPILPEYLYRMIEDDSKK